MSELVSGLTASRFSPALEGNRVYMEMQREAVGMLKRNRLTFCTLLTLEFQTYFNTSARVQHSWTFRFLWPLDGWTFDDYYALNNYTITTTLHQYDMGWRMPFLALLRRRYLLAMPVYYFGWIAVRLDLVDVQKTYRSEFYAAHQRS